MSRLPANKYINPKTKLLNIFRLSKIQIFLEILVLLFLFTISSLAQMTTTGPVRPSGVDEGIRPVTRNQVIIPRVPYYVWQHGCGPTALGMVIGYYDSHGCRHLVEGSAAGQTSAVNDMIAQDNGNLNCNDTTYSDHYHDYSCPRDGGITIPDKSELGGAHSNNCVADFMGTSRSSYGLGYGWSWNDMTPVAYIDYINYIAPHYTKSTEMIYFWDFTWEAYKTEIDAGRPMALHVDIDANGDTDHMITAVGYEEVNGLRYYACHDTWDNRTHWFQWREISVGIGWGIMSVVTFNCFTIPKTIHVPADYATIQAAVEAADEGDTILVADGIYSGPGNRDIVLEGKPIILSENGPEVTIINCGGSESEPHQGIIIGSGFGPETRIDGFTIRNAYFTGPGAGIMCANSSLIISNCIIENNYAFRGGGICIYGSSPIITNCIFRNNSGNEGGAMYFANWAMPIIDECIIENNNADLGGGVNSNLSKPLIQNTLFSGNVANNGGAYYNKMLGGTIKNSNFCMNSSSNGAAFHLSYHDSELLIENTIIAFNTQGEAIYCADPDNVPSLTCVDIFDNEGGDWTGGIANQQIQNGNFSANPLFCDMVTGDYGLYVTSPCASANSLCGTLVGIHDVGCLTEYICGDANSDGEINLADIIFVIEYYFYNGPRPVPQIAGDVTCDGWVGLIDIINLNDYLFNQQSLNCCISK